LFLILENGDSWRKFFNEALRDLLKSYKFIRAPTYLEDYNPNVVVEWLTTPLRIRDVLASDLGQEIGYPD
jgi:hypothetical protein